MAGLLAADGLENHRSIGYLFSAFMLLERPNPSDGFQCEINFSGCRLNYPSATENYAERNDIASAPNRDDSEDGFADFARTGRMSLVRSFPSMPPESDNPIPSDRRFQDERAISPGMHGLGEGSDKSLIDRVRVREQRAMTEIFDRYAGLVYSVALRVLKDSGHAEDVTQDIFFQLWRNPDCFSANRGSLGSWLLVVARNRAIDRLRQNRFREPMEEVMVASPMNLEIEAERGIIMQRVQGLIGDLSKEQQQSLQMAFFEGLSHSEIAEKIGQPLGTVKTRIRSALISLRKRLEA
jgi:RNA polymerase sigma-70 factor, ECF subfamily